MVVDVFVSEVGAPTGRGEAWRHLGTKDGVRRWGLNPQFEKPFFFDQPEASSFPCEFAKWVASPQLRRAGSFGVRFYTSQQSRELSESSYSFR